jgi:nucleotide-binding universal stress UspA family protein
MYKKILLPLDGSPLSQQAVPYAVELARQFNAQLLLLRVVQPVVVPVVEYGYNRRLVEALHKQMWQDAEAYLQEMQRQPEIASLKVTPLLCEGDVAQSIIDAIEQYDVDTVVMATHGRGGLSRWVLGSVADRIVRGSPVPVLLIRAAPVRVKDEEVVARRQAMPMFA